MHYFCVNFRSISLVFDVGVCLTTGGSKFGFGKGPRLKSALPLANLQLSILSLRFWGRDNTCTWKRTSCADALHASEILIPHWLGLLGGFSSPSVAVLLPLRIMQHGKRPSITCLPSWAPFSLPLSPVELTDLWSTRLLSISSLWELFPWLTLEQIRQEKTDSHH